MPKKFKDSRRASRKLKEVLRDRPFGVGAAMSWDDPSILYDDWDGEVFDESDEDQGLEDGESRPLKFN